MKRPRIALLTTPAARGEDEDLALLSAALEQRGAEVAVVDWGDDAVDLARFTVAILRSTWDYTQRLADFLRWAERADAATQLLNPLAIVRWNTDKHYLRDLAERGVPVVPSAFIAPDSDAAAVLDAFLPAHADSAEFVVKPTVGAGSRDAQRYLRSERAAMIAHAERLTQAGRSVMLQPYLARVDARGETSLLYFDGAFSHAIRKGQLLVRGQPPTRALFAPEHIQPRTPSAAEYAVAERALKAIPSSQPLLYARVDLLEDEAGQPRVLELELTEPSVFLRYGSGATERMADAVMARAARVHAGG